MTDLNGRLARLEAQFGPTYQLRPICRIDTGWDGVRPLEPGEFTLRIFKPYGEEDNLDQPGGPQ